MGKLLKVIHPDPYDKGEVLSGNCAPDGTVYINVEYIWDVTKSFNNFAKYFSKVMEHETLHRLINDELGRKSRSQVSEERIVRMLTHEQFRSWHKRFYAKEDKRVK
jgi:hypothetical protein